MLHKKCGSGDHKETETLNKEERFHLKHQN